MTHGSLFSGIGGFDLAAEWMGWENKFHCEWNEFGQKVLHHYWPNAEQFTDIKKSNFTKYANRIDILTGGFPCQPYSSAGKRLGKEDDRHLWPEMLRAIKEIQPRWIVGENVYGLVNWIESGLLPTPSVADTEGSPKRIDQISQGQNGTFYRTSDNTGTRFGAKLNDVARLLPTPTAMIGDAYADKSPNSHLRHTQNIATLAAKGMLPTPNTRDWKDSIGNGIDAPSIGKTRGYSLGQKINSMLPTPAASDWKGAYRPESMTNKDGTFNREERLVNIYLKTGQEYNSKTSQLSPHFVMEMMGFPTDWTLLPFLSGEQNP